MYITLVTLSLTLVFGSSAYMSIYGLLSIFPNDPYIIICMGLGMEIGKVLTISHLYRTWHKNTALVKSWFVFIIFVLTFLTSFEVMGFLSQCHQKSIRSNHIIQSEIKALDKKEIVIKGQIQIIDKTLNGLPEAHVSRRINERKISGYAEKQESLVEIINQRAVLEKQLISEDSSSNPGFAIADIFEVENSDIISILIPLLVLILEPLSIGLTIAVNAAWLNYKEHEPLKDTSKVTKDNTEELQILQKKYDISIEKIAEITNRKKLKTCREWLDGSVPTPPRALAEVQAWVERESGKPDG